jgi:hypothetical protein
MFDWPARIKTFKGPVGGVGAIGAAIAEPIRKKLVVSSWCVFIVFSG